MEVIFNKWNRNFKEKATRLVAIKLPGEPILALFKTAVKTMKSDLSRVYSKKKEANDAKAQKKANKRMRELVTYDDGKPFYSLPMDSAVGSVPLTEMIEVVLSFTKRKTKALVYEIILSL